jgi:hypothetical protein
VLKYEGNLFFKCGYEVWSRNEKNVVRAEWYLSTGVFECGCNRPLDLCLELDTIFYTHFFKKDSTEVLIGKFTQKAVPPFFIVKMLWKMKLVNRTSQFIGYICIALPCKPFHYQWCYTTRKWLCISCWQKSVVPFEALFILLAILLYSLINISQTALMQASGLFWVFLTNSPTADPRYNLLFLI